jgi:hypothetical protein
VPDSPGIDAAPGMLCKHNSHLTTGMQTLRDALGKVPDRPGERRNEAPAPVRARAGGNQDSSAPAHEEVYLDYVLLPQGRPHGAAPAR